MGFMLIPAHREPLLWRDGYVNEMSWRHAPEKVSRPDWLIYRAKDQSKFAIDQKSLVRTKNVARVMGYFDTGDEYDPTNLIDYGFLCDGRVSESVSHVPLAHTDLVMDQVREFACRAS